LLADLSGKAEVFLFKRVCALMGAKMNS